MLWPCDTNQEVTDNETQAEKGAQALPAPISYFITPVLDREKTPSPKCLSSSPQEVKRFRVQWTPLTLQILPRIPHYLRQLNKPHDLSVDLAVLFPKGSAKEAAVLIQILI